MDPTSPSLASDSSGFQYMKWILLTCWYFCNFLHPLPPTLGFPDGSVNSLPATQETRETQVVSGEIPWRRKWQPTLISLPGKIPWTEEPGGL